MINVVDTETTGFDPRDGGVCEIACVAVGDTIGDGYFQSLVNPGFPIGCDAMGTHHITNEMVADAPSLDMIFFDRGLGVHDVWAAHNAEFDMSFLPEHVRSPQRRWICTWRCAMHIWPDAPSHKNQALRYWLGLDVSDMPEEAGKNAHRALYDAWVTAKLLRRMITWISLRDHSGVEDITTIQAIVNELIRLSTAPLILKKVRFGKHRDSLWVDVDRGYMQWCLRQDFDKDVIHTCKHHLGILV